MYAASVEARTSLFPSYHQLDLVFAAETTGEYIDRKAEIWNLFFRMMTVAFVVGGVIAGTMVWQVWRFRESNPNAKRTPYEEGES